MFPVCQKTVLNLNLTLNLSLSATQTDFCSRNSLAVRFRGLWLQNLVESTGLRKSAVCRLQERDPETNLKPDELSPKERRKLRNERREQLKEKRGSWKEDVESKLDVKKKPPKGWEEILDIDRLATKGYQWWMLSVPKNNEKKAADQLDIIFPERFPRVKYEVFSPSVPARKKLKDGRFSDARQRLYPGCLLVRCVLNREVYDLIRSIYQVRDFFGTKANTSVSEMIIPAAVSIVEMDELFKRIEKEEAEFKILNEVNNKEVDERERLDKEITAKKEAEAPLPPKLEEGALVQINSGPFINHTGVVSDIDYDDETLHLMVMVFGKPTTAKMRIEQVSVLEGAKSKSLIGLAEDP